MNGDQAYIAQLVCETVEDYLRRAVLRRTLAPVRLRVALTRATAGDLDAAVANVRSNLPAIERIPGEFRNVYFHEDNFEKCWAMLDPVRCWYGDMWRGRLLYVYGTDRGCLTWFERAAQALSSLPPETCETSRAITLWAYTTQAAALFFKPTRYAIRIPAECLQNSVVRCCVLQTTAIAALIVGDWDGAIEAGEEVLSEHSAAGDRMSAQMRMAAAYWHLGDHRKARQMAVICERTIPLARMAISRSWAALQVWIFWSHLGDDERAQRWYEYAIDQSPDPVTRESIGRRADLLSQRCSMANRLVV